MAKNTNKGAGRYIVNGVLVNAWGEPVEEPAAKKRTTRTKKGTRNVQNNAKN